MQAVYRMSSIDRNALDSLARTGLKYRRLLLRNEGCDCYYRSSFWVAVDTFLKRSASETMTP